MVLEGLEKKKDELLNKTNSLKSAIEEKLNEVTGDVSDLTRKAVFAGGAVVGVALVIALLKPRKKKLKLGGTELAVSTGNNDNPIVTMIKGAITTFLLNLARQKIVEFLEQLTHHEEGEKEGSLVSASVTDPTLNIKL